MVVKINRDAEKLGQRLQKYRELANVTQSEMGEACGLSKNYISSIERGVHKCNAKTFIAYGEKCKVSLDILAGHSDSSSVLVELTDVLATLTMKQQQQLLEIAKILGQS